MNRIKCTNTCIGSYCEHVTEDIDILSRRAAIDSPSFYKTTIRDSWLASLTLLVDEWKDKEFLQLEKFPIVSNNREKKTETNEAYRHKNYKRLLSFKILFTFLITYLYVHVKFTKSTKFMIVSKRKEKWANTVLWHGDELIDWKISDL